MRASSRWPLGHAVALAVLFAAPGAGEQTQRFSFATLEGQIVEVSEQKGEGELQLLTVDLVTDEPQAKKVTVLLGPVEICREIGLVVEDGDRVRVRVFVTEEGGDAVKAQKILNLSRRVMVRLRTTHDVPLWNSAGAWHGGPGRPFHGGQHGTRRGGASGPGRGPGRP